MSGAAIPVLVVGTSNSLRKTGYADYLSRIPGIAVTNVSLGASCCLMSIWRTREVDFSAFRYCLLDFAVNEDVMLRNGAIGEGVIRAVFASLACRAMAAGCLPVVLILPRLQARPGPARALYRDLAREFRLPWLDGWDFVEQAHAAAAIATPAMFVDSAHMQGWLAAAMAEVIAAGLRRLDATPDGWEAQGWSAGALSSVAAPEAGAATVERGNSRFSGRFLRVMAPGAVTFPVPAGSEVLGWRLNLTETRCVLQPDGAEPVPVQSGLFHSREFPLVIAALPCPRPLPCPDGRFGLAVEHLGAHQGQAEIAEVFLGGVGTVHSPRRPREDRHQNLLAGDEGAALRTACAAYRFLVTAEAEEEAVQRYEALMRAKREKRKARRAAAA